MYEILFLACGKNVPEEHFVRLLVADMERALAIASMLQKVSTPEVTFGGIIVEPFKLENHEKEKK